MNDESSIEQQWAALNGDQATPGGLLDDRQNMQREQDHFGFVVVGALDEQAAAGDVIDGISIGLDREDASDIKLKVLGPSSVAEWREHSLFLFGPQILAEFDFCMSRRDYWIVRAIAE